MKDVAIELPGDLIATDTLRDFDEEWLDDPADSQELSNRIETEFGDAGWYGRSAQPYPPPETPFDAPPSSNPPKVAAIRRLWIARYNPGEERWRDHPDDWSASDINDDASFPWRHPEAAPRRGWWLSTERTQRAAIMELALGDLVVAQRTDPGAGNRLPTDRFKSNMLIGLAAVVRLIEWRDDTGERQREVCLLPLTKFDHPVPTATAKSRHRLKRPSFSAPRELQGRQGQPAFGLSAVEWEDTSELLSVCGIHPSVLAEPDLAVLAARLEASTTGSHELLKLRYDHQYRDQARRRNEQAAVVKAIEWAAGHNFVVRADCQLKAGEGYDLLMGDDAGRVLQLEVKGYSATKLSSVHLQPSQERRARAAAAGQPPAWKLFAVLGSGSNTPTTRLLDATEVVALLDKGGLKVKHPR